MNGELQAVNLPWPILGATTQAMIPEIVAVLVGKEGSGKSIWLMQAILEWAKSGIQVACLMLESGKDYHIRRAVAQEACEPGLLDNKWQADPANAKTIWAIHKQHSGLMDLMEGVIYDAPAFMATVDYTIEWLCCRAQEGCRVAIVDPVTMIHYDNPKDISGGTKRLVKTCIDIANKCEMTIILVNHYNKDGLTMQGGASLSDHSDCVLELTALPGPKNVTLAVPDHDNLSRSGQVNAVMLVKKARKGSLCWHKIGFFFDKQDLTFTEKGIILGGKSK